MQWLIFALLFIACSKDQSSILAPPLEPEPIIPQPQSKPCKTTHQEPFKCVRGFTHTNDMRNYSLIINNELSTLPDFAKIPNIPHNTFQLHILSKNSKDLKKLLRNNLFITEIDITDLLPKTPVMRHYWEPNENRWNDILARNTSNSPLPLENQKYSWITEAWDQVLKNQGEATVEFFSANGCAGHCIITTKHPSLPNHRITEVSEYVSGLTIRHQVIIEETGLPVLQARFSVIEIDPAESPNLIYVFDNNLEIYARNGEILLISARETHFEKLQDELSLRDKRAGDNSHAVIICDTGAKPSMLANFKIGPRTDLSFWGWLGPDNNATELSLWQQLSGISVLSEVNWGYWGQPHGFAQHGTSVGHIATDNTNLSVISISADQCLSGYKLWKDNVKPHARVINMSAWFPYDYDSCTNEPRFKDSVRDREQPFLWVVGAGNDARKGLLAKNTSYCPQSLGGRDNLIVVSALNAGYSNDGLDYADIAADGTGHFPNEKGTSFASPRVARVAAILAEEFPNLSIAQIKQAIMQGAYIPTPRLANRSGGILDEAGARRIAKQLSSK